LNQDLPFGGTKASGYGRFCKGGKGSVVFWFADRCVFITFSWTGRVTRFDEPQGYHFRQVSMVDPNLDSPSCGLPYPLARPELVRTITLRSLLFIHD
jgi:hypothetical protein